MSENLITKESIQVRSFLDNIERLRKSIENIVENNRPYLGGERYLTDSEVSDLLKISRRTLQDYRDEGKVSYVYFGGKMLYRESDLEKMLQDNYVKAWV